MINAHQTYHGLMKIDGSTWGCIRDLLSGQFFCFLMEPLRPSLTPFQMFSAEKKKPGSAIACQALLRILHLPPFEKIKI